MNLKSNVKFSLLLDTKMLIKMYSDLFITTVWYTMEDWLLTSLSKQLIHPFLLQEVYVNSLEDTWLSVKENLWEWTDTTEEKWDLD